MEHLGAVLIQLFAVLLAAKIGDEVFKRLGQPTIIGAQVDLSALAGPNALLLLLALTGIAVASKFAGAFVGAIRAGSARATLIGVGMVPRGEVGIVVAGLGLSAGAINGELYSVVVGMAILTTLLVPPLLPVLVRRAEPGPGRGPS